VAVFVAPASRRRFGEPSTRAKKPARRRRYKRRAGWYSALLAA